MDNNMNLTSEQIKNWRNIIFMRLESIHSGSGAYALIMPESEVIDYAQKMKTLLESPMLEKAVMEEEKKPFIERKTKEPCKHTNSFTGNNGKYCVDCEKYV